MTDSGKNSDNIKDYIQRIAPYLFFFAVAIVVLIMWIFYCTCFCKPYCCFISKYDDDYIRKIAFVLTLFCFALVIGGCITGYFVKDLFMKDVSGIVCGFDRFYFDIMEGQKSVNTPRWTGLENLGDKLTSLKNALNNINGKKYTPESNEWTQNGKQPTTSRYETSINNLVGVSSTFSYNTKLQDSSSLDTYKGMINNEVYSKINFYYESLNIITQNSLLAQFGQEKIKSISSNIDSFNGNMGSFLGSFSDFKGKVIDDVDDYQGYIKDYAKKGFVAILSVELGFAGLIILCIIAYIYIDYQKPFKIILHFAWNFSLFFTFLSFILGGVFGILNLASIDGIGFLRYIFDEENLSSPEPKLIPAGDATTYLQKCLHSQNSDLSSEFELDDGNRNNLNEIYNYSAYILQVQPNIESDKTLLSVKEILKEIEIYRNDIILVSSDAQQKFDLMNSAIKTTCSMNEYVTSKQSRCSSSATCYTLENYNIDQLKQHYASCSGVDSYLDEIKNLISKNEEDLNKIKSFVDNIQIVFNSMMETINEKIGQVDKDFGQLVRNFENISVQTDLFSFLDCKFMSNYVNIIYETFYDFSNTSGYFAAVFLSISFAELIGIYCLLLSIYRYDNSIQKPIVCNSGMDEEKEFNPKCEKGRIGLSADDKTINM